MADADYALATSRSEWARLARQGERFAEATARVFRTAGIGPGMRVLDVGCGAGDVSLLLATLVGRGGSIVGVDRDPQSLAVTRARLAERPEVSTTFVEGDFRTAPVGDGFDAAVGRFVLMYQSDPVEAVGAVAKRVHPGGSIAFLEPGDGERGFSCPTLPLWERMNDIISKVFHRTGTNREIGIKLWATLKGAGLVDVEMAAVDSFLYYPHSPYLGLTVDILRSMVPKMREHGIANPDELGLDTLEQRLNEEAVRLNGVTRGPVLYGASGRVPGAA